MTMVFGIYAVDEDTSSVVDIRRYIGKFVRVNEHVKSFHALYLSKGTNTLYCDFIVDYALRDWEGLQKIIYRLYEETVSRNMRYH